MQSGISISGKAWILSDVILHMGMEKTGSSSIQNSFVGYDDGRVLYVPFKWDNHSMPLSYLFRGWDKLEPRFGPKGLTHDMYLERKAEAQEALDAALQGDRETLLLSAEALMGFGPYEHREVRDHIRQYRQKIRVMAYVREPIGYSSSAFQQSLKFGGDTLRVPPQRFQGRLGRLYRVYEPSEVELIPFRPKTFPNGSVVQDFAQRIGADVSRITEQSTNESMCMYAAAAMFLWNRDGVKAHDSRDGFKARTNVSGFLQRMSKIPKLRKLKLDALGREIPRGLRKFRLSEDYVRAHIDIDDIRWMEQEMGATLLEGASSAKSDDYGIRSEADLIELGHEAFKWLEPGIARNKVKPAEKNTVAALNAMYDMFYTRATKRTADKAAQSAAQ